MTKDEVIENMVEVELIAPENFLKVKETLTRMGIASRRQNTLFQSCHILHKRGRYFIPHFKELFLLDGKKANFDDEDRRRRNTIVSLLEEWGLVRIVNPDILNDEYISLKKIKIIPHHERGQWNLVAKYSLGKG